MRQGVSFSIMVVALGVAAAEEPVVFVDPELKAAVEETLGVSDPTPTDMQGLNELNARERGISDLTGIESALNVNALYLSGNQISDISLLAGLTSLSGAECSPQFCDGLDLSNNQITDISPLAGLTGLTSVGLDGNQISDLSPLAGLTELQVLGLSNNQITDISPLAGLMRLWWLNLSSNPLDCIAYCETIPAICENNLGLWEWWLGVAIWIEYDPVPEDCGCAIFIRGDSNSDGNLDIADAVCVLSYLFGPAGDPCKEHIPTCLDAADANDDGAVDIADAIAVLSHLFAGAGPLPEPFGECGIDPTVDELGCTSYEPCEDQ